MKMKQIACSALMAAALSFSSPSFASGYEKSVYWSGKYSGVAGAATGSVSGAESLFFNPAGLAGARTSPGDVSVNFSPTWVHYNSPPAQDYESQRSNTRLVPVYGVMASYQIMPKLTVGLGNYVVGGNKSNYDNISFNSVNAGFSNLRPSTRGDLDVIENALGIGYEVIPGLKVGATWRVTQVNASLYSTSVGTTPAPSLLGLKLDDLKDTRWNGYKVGVQYTGKDEQFGLGASYRSQVIFNANGNSSGQVVIPAISSTPSTVTGGRVAVRSMLPAQAIFGGFYHFKEQKLKVMSQYEFVNYSKVQQLDLTGSVGLPAPIGTVNLGSSPIQLRYKDQHLVRVGAEYEADEKCTFRAGYSWTSRVSSPGYSLTTFFPAAPSHSLLAGYGHKFSDKVEFNMAAEYMFSTDTVTAQEVAAAGTTPTQEGQYKTRVVTLHTGVVFKF